MPPLPVLSGVEAVRAFARAGWHAAAVAFAVAFLASLGACDRAPIAAPATGPAGGVTHAAARPRPNIVLISLDTLRPDHLGFAGYPLPTSPNLDRFASGAAVFRNAHTQAPWTHPSHTSLLTSTLPSHNGVEHLGAILPKSIVTLPQLLQAGGYHTAAIVNDGQMFGEWGYDRGFDRWKQLIYNLPEGDCEHITDAALQWVAESPREPWFLFLHYYDAHEPYHPPEPFRSRFGADAFTQADEGVLWAQQYPATQPRDPEAVKRMIAAYDGDIAWLDHHLGRLLDGLDPNTLVVLFSDHGEAFGEHGYLRHGNTLYDEETRVLLTMRVPAGLLAASASASKGASGAGGGPPPRVIDEPAMLLDVAPTLLALAGEGSHPQFQGQDLGAVLAGGRLAERAIPSETKYFAGGSVRKSVLRHPWKFIYSVPDHAAEFYRMPDERTTLIERERSGAEPFWADVARWMEGEDFWLIHFRGDRRYRVTLTPLSGSVIAAFPVGFRHDRSALEPGKVEEGLTWEVSPGPEGAASLFVEVTPAGAGFLVDVETDGVRELSRVFAGAARLNPPVLPAEVELSGDLLPAVQPTGELPDGVWITRRRGTAGRATDRETQTMGPEMRERLRSLGYIQ